MKRKIFPVILTCALFFSCYAVLIESVFAQGFKPGTEPTNFRGIDWGEHINSLSEMRFATETRGMRFYTKENDTLMMNDATLSLILYGFYKDRLCSVTITFKWPENFEEIKKTLFIAYGEGEKRDESDEFLEELLWRGKNVFISLEYDKIITEGQINWFYRPIMEERERDNK